MQFRKLLITGSAAALLAYGPVWAQQNPTGQSPQSPNATSQSPTAQSPASPTSPTTTESPSVSSSSASVQQNMSNQKEKHWTGSLVDVRCMAKALGSETAPATPSGVAAQTPHYMSGSPDQLQQTGQPGGGGGAMGPAGSQSRTGTAPTYPGQESGQNPDMSQTQARASAAAQRMDEAAKQCAASGSTQTFGLALSDGKVVQLDSEGNAKASEAIKAVDVQPGKKVKAKVTGVLEANNTVSVASVDVKGKKVSPSSSMGGAAGEVK